MNIEAADQLVNKKTHKNDYENGSGAISSVAMDIGAGHSSTRWLTAEKFDF